MVVEPYTACWLSGPGRLIQLHAPLAKWSAVASEKYVRWNSSQHLPNAQMFVALTAERVASGRSVQLPLEPKYRGTERLLQLVPFHRFTIAGFEVVGLLVADHSGTLPGDVDVTQEVVLEPSL
jgi:hypothetical protein